MYYRIRLKIDIGFYCDEYEVYAKGNRFDVVESVKRLIIRIRKDLIKEGNKNPHVSLIRMERVTKEEYYQKQFEMKEKYKCNLRK